MRTTASGSSGDFVNWEFGGTAERQPHEGWLRPRALDSEGERETLVRIGPRMDGLVLWADIESREHHRRTGNHCSPVPAVRRNPAPLVLLRYRLAEVVLGAGMIGDDAGGSSVVLVVAAAGRSSRLIAPGPTEHREAGPRRERQNDG